MAVDALCCVYQIRRVLLRNLNFVLLGNKIAPKGQLSWATYVG